MGGGTHRDTKPEHYELYNSYYDVISERNEGNLSVCLSVFPSICLSYV